MAIGEEENQNGGASGERAVIPLRWRRLVGAKARKDLLWDLLALILCIRYGLRIAGLREDATLHMRMLELGVANLQQKIGKAPWSQWLCFGRAMLLASWDTRAMAACEIRRGMSVTEAIDR
jgi:hypothetical protein